MTPLEPRTTRDAIGIDTFERGLLYAVEMVRASNTDPGNLVAGKPNKYFTAARIVAKFDNVTAAGIEGTVSLSLKLPYDSQSALKEGGNFVENIGDFNNIDPSPFRAICAPSIPNLFPIPIEPEWVYTLERFAAWCASNLIGGHIALNSKKSPPVSINFLEEDPQEPSLQINAILKVNTRLYLESNNLLSAIVSQVRSGVGVLRVEDASTLLLTFGGTSEASVDFGFESVGSVLFGGSSVSEITSDSAGQFSFGGSSTASVVGQETVVSSSGRSSLNGSSTSEVIDSNTNVTSTGQFSFGGSSTASVLNAPTVPQNGLVGAWEASTGVTLDATGGSTTVALVADQSSVSQTGANDATQTTKSSQPLFVNSVINGHPIFRFNGSSTFLKTNGVFYSAKMIIALFRQNAFRIGDGIISCRPSPNTNKTSASDENNGMLGVNGGTGLCSLGFADFVYLNGVAKSVADFNNFNLGISLGNNTNFHLVEAVRLSSGSGSKFWVIGADTFSSERFFNGDLAMILIFNVNDDATRLEARNYAKTKYNLNLP